MDRTDVAVERQHRLRGAGTSVLAHEPEGEDGDGNDAQGDACDVHEILAAVRLHHAGRTGAACGVRVRMNGAMTFLRRYGRFLLLAFVPIAVGLELTMPENHTAIFCASVLAILPLAAMIGRATDVLADRLGGGIGGLLNATFGNAAELIIGALALREGLYRSGQGLADRVDHRQRAARLRRRRRSSAACSIRPSASTAPRRAWARPCCCSARSAWSSRPCSIGWRAAAGSGVELKLDTEIAVVLFATYCASLIFTLRTHRSLFGPSADGSRGE